MEYLNNTVQSLLIENNNIIITYDSNDIETIPISLQSYINMYNTWLLNEPVFISDKFKSILNLIILCNNSESNVDKYATKLNAFFIKSNEEEVKKFIIYMRGRSVFIANEKIKWTKIKEDI
jgi:hypothetical protein